MGLYLNGMQSNNSLMDYELNYAFCGVLIGISMGLRASFPPITIVTYPLSWQQVSWFLPRPSVTHEQTTNRHLSRTQ